MLDWEVSRHAAQRWDERVGDGDMIAALDRARQVKSKKMLERLRRTCPGHVDEVRRLRQAVWAKETPKMYLYTKDWLGPKRHVFWVVVPKEGERKLVVVTCWPADKEAEGGGKP